MSISQEISREIAIYEAMLNNDGFDGENFPAARRKLRGVIIRPADINLVDEMAKQMYGTMLQMKGGQLRLNIERARERLEQLVQRLNHPSHKDIGDPLEARIRELAVRLDSQLLLV